MEPRFYPYSPERDVYRLLQVEPTADADEITAAIRRLARTFHPDRNGSPRATEEMQVVNAVRHLLIDPQARATYDRARYRFLAENAARRRREAVLAARSGVTLPAKRRTRPVRARIALTGRALLAALIAILDAFAPARGRLLTTDADGVRRRGPVIKSRPAAAAASGPRPSRPAFLWEPDAKIVLESDPVAAEVGDAPSAPDRPAFLWELDARIVLEPIAMELPPMEPLPIRSITGAIPIAEPREEQVAASHGTVVPYRSTGDAIAEALWEASARMVAESNNEVDVQACGRCGLWLSTSARFCRRCGTSQARSA